jgi:hypothetical protein
MTQEIHGTVADGFEGVREEFAAFVAGELPDYEGQLCAYVRGRRVVDLWVGDGCEAPLTSWSRSSCRTARWSWTAK